MNKKPYTDPRWKEWPKSGIITSSKPTPKKTVVKEIDKWLKDLEKENNGKR